MNITDINKFQQLKYMSLTSDSHIQNVAELHVTILVSGQYSTNCLKHHKKKKSVINNLTYQTGTKHKNPQQQHKNKNEISELFSGLPYEMHSVLHQLACATI